MKYRKDLFTAYYMMLLHRPLDAAGLTDWLNSGWDASSVVFGVEASAEFYTNG